uniref:Uncharacterized protein n=1 Tax=Medicago truncatula TaxID=3880 RepID=I3SH98_MEDTR|nr:unknown [Medicago truncatula]
MKILTDRKCTQKRQPGALKLPHTHGPGRGTHVIVNRIYKLRFSNTLHKSYDGCTKSI